MLFDGVVRFLVFDSIASGDEIFFGTEEVFNGVAGHSGEPVVELPAIAIVFKVFNFLPDFGENGLANVFGVGIGDAHAEDETEDESAVGGFEFEPSGLIFSSAETLEEGHTCGFKFGGGHGVPVL